MSRLQTSLGELALTLLLCLALLGFLVFGVLVLLLAIGVFLLFHSFLLLVRPLSWLAGKWRS